MVEIVNLIGIFYLLCSTSFESFLELFAFTIFKEGWLRLLMPFASLPLLSRMRDRLLFRGSISRREESSNRICDRLVKLG